MGPFPPSAPGLWLYLLSGEHRTKIPGLFVLGAGTISDDLRWPVKAVKAHLTTLINRGHVRVDVDTNLMWLPKSLDHNMPDNPNMVMGWKRDWQTLPDSTLKAEAREEIRKGFAALPPPEKSFLTFAEAFAVALGERPPPASGDQKAKAPPKGDGKGGGKVPPTAPPNDGETLGGTEDSEGVGDGEKSPPPTPPREPTTGGLEPTSALNADDIHALDLVAALASAPGALFSAAMGSDEDRLIVGRLMVVDGVDATFARRMSELLRRPDEVWPWSKDFPKGGMKRVSVAWLRGAKTPNGQGSGCALSQLVDATRAMILAEERKASRRVDVRQPPTTPTDPKNTPGTPEFIAENAAAKAIRDAQKAANGRPATVPSSPALTLVPPAAETA